jgi:hypothetical protein
MNQNAVNAARVQLGRATQSLTELKGSNDFATIETHWAAFLVAMTRVFTKLEQGSKTSYKSNAWWGRRVHEKKTDPLLRYLLHARNADEHTLQQITEFNPGRAHVGQPTAQEIADLHHQLEHETRPHAVLGLAEVVFPHVVLKEVVDKGVRFSPPQSHLDVPLTNTSPAHVGDLALAYLEAMIKEAAELAA